MRQRGFLLRLFHLLAGTLAVLGLNGHGIAMLLVAIALPQNVAAQHELPSRIEICSPQGLRTIAQPFATLAGEPENGGSPPSQQKPADFKACPVCTVFAQSGAADLPQTAACFDPDCGAASWRADCPPALPAAGRLRVQARGPPQAA